MSGSIEAIPRAITRCPACNTSFRITESQLLAAEGSVRCGACLFVFQAEDYFVSPMLDVTELLAIEEEYWVNFESYVHQVAGLDPDDFEQSDSEPGDPDRVTAIVRPEQESSEPGGVEFWNPLDQALPLGEESGKELPGEVIGYWQPARQRILVSITEPEERYEPAVFSVGIWDPPVNPVAFWEPVEATEPAPYWDDELPDDVPTLDLDIEDDTASLVMDRRRKLPLGDLKWLPGIAAMVLVGLLQYAYFHINTYAQDVRYGP